MGCCPENISRRGMRCPQMYEYMDFSGRSILQVLETLVEILGSGADRNYKMRIKSILEEKKKGRQQREQVKIRQKNIELFIKKWKSIFSKCSVWRECRSFL